MMRLRKEAEFGLGAEFDIKSFHDSLLVSGAMTLPLLAEVVPHWLRSS